MISPMHTHMTVYIDNSGDHIRVVNYATDANPNGLYDHHMLVIDVLDGISLKVIHHTGVVVKEEVIKLNAGEYKIELLEYPEQTEQFPSDKAIERARGRLGEEKYNIFNNNCECFVNWAITDKAISIQSEVGSVAAISGAVFGAVGGFWREGTLNGVLKGGVDGMQQSFQKFRDDRP